MTYLLDTDVFSLAYFAKHGLRERIDRERASNNTVQLSIVSRIEVLRGRYDAILKATDGATLAKAQEVWQWSRQYLNTFPTIVFDTAALDHFDRLRAMKLPGKPSRNDLLIACIALARDATLVTRNIKDFANIPNLKLDNWAA